MTTTFLKRILRQGEDLFSNGEVGKAAACFQKALEMDPLCLEALNNMGVVAFHNGALEEAVSHLRKALEVDPNYPDAIENLGLCMEAKGCFREATTFLRKRIEIGEVGPRILNSMGNCLLQLDDLDAAYKAYRQSLEIDGRQPLVRSILNELRRLTDLKKRGQRPIAMKSPSSSRSQGLKVPPRRNVYKIQIISFSDLERDVERRFRWGDYWLKWELKRVFEAMGHRVTDTDPDILIHLFGIPINDVPKHPYKILWIHSHPDLVCPEVLNQYERIYCLSLPFLDKIRGWGFEADLLIGATAKRPVKTELRHDIVFVGNAKGPGGRRIIKDLGKTAYDLKVWGEGWENIIPPENYAGLYYENERLSELYAASRIVLNDHHEDMRREGFLNPRILDVFASGGFVISDDIQGIEGTFGETLVRYKDPEHLRDLVRYYISHPEERRRKIEQGRQIAQQFTFVKTAEKILEDLGRTDSRQGTRRRKATQHETGGQTFLLEKGQKCLADDLLEEAQKCFEEILARDAYSVDGAHYLAVTLLKRGKREEAITALKKCMAIDPSFESAIVLLKRLLVESIAEKSGEIIPPERFTFVHAAWEKDNPSFPEMTPSVIAAFHAISCSNPELSLLVCSRSKLKDYPWEVIEIVRNNGRITFQEMEEECLEEGKGSIFVYPACSVRYRDKLRYALSVGLPVITTSSLGRGTIRNGYNGLLIRAKDFQARGRSEPRLAINDLAISMFFLARDPALILELSRNAARERNDLDGIRFDASQRGEGANEAHCP